MASSSSQPTPPSSSAGSLPPATPPPTTIDQTQARAQPENPTLNKHIHSNPYLKPIALVATPLALVGLCLPPRKFDIRTLILGGVGIWGTNQLTLEYTGQSFAQRTTARVESFAARMEMPDTAREVQGRLREEKERRARLRVLRDEMVRKGDAPAPPSSSAAAAIAASKGNGPGSGNGDAYLYEGWTDAQKRALLEAYEREKKREEEEKKMNKDGGKGKGKGEKEKKEDEEEEKKKKKEVRMRLMQQAMEKKKEEEEKEKKKIKTKEEMSWLQRVWLGNADPDWKEKRDQKEREALREGGIGYWGLITEQISEVWNGEKKEEGGGTGEGGGSGEESAKGKTGDDVKK